MLRLPLLPLHGLRRVARPRADLILENLALRQQVSTLKEKRLLNAPQKSPT